MLLKPDGFSRIGQQKRFHLLDVTPQSRSDDFHWCYCGGNRGTLTFDLYHAAVQLNKETHMTLTLQASQLAVAPCRSNILTTVVLHGVFPQCFLLPIFTESQCQCIFRHLNQSSIVGSDREHYLQWGWDYPTHDPFFYAPDKRNG